MIPLMSLIVADSARTLREVAAQLEPQQPEMARQLRQVAANLTSSMKPKLAAWIERTKTQPGTVPEAFLRQQYLTLQMLEGASAEEETLAQQLIAYLEGEHHRLLGEPPDFATWVQQAQTRAEQMQAALQTTRTAEGITFVESIPPATGDSA